MNLPNRLTVARFLLTGVFVACMSVPLPYGYSAAFGIFVLATITDYLDGSIARRWNLITDFGKLMDPLADKILTASAFICLAALPGGLPPAWVVIVIVAREFLITGLRLLAGTKGIVLPAEKMGKHKTAWQMITILFFLFMLAMRDWHALPPAWYEGLWLYGGSLLVVAMTFLTVWSGLGYFWKNRALITTA